MSQSNVQNIKKEHLSNIRKAGVNPYPAKASKRSSLLSEIGENFKKYNSKKVSIVGRVMTIRSHGKVTFATLKDFSGLLQIYLRFDDLGKEKYDFFKNIDLGDFIECSGKVFKTHMGEVTVQTSDYKILSKSLENLPEKWHGLSDVEERHRKRYLDILFNDEVKNNFAIKSKIIKSLRDYLDNKGFIEVETPIFQPIPGGATAKPFKTHLNALKMDLYLRIAPELYLKRLLVGGFEKIYELGRNFRNEGVDTTHNPEFTMLEIYEAYQDYNYGMDFAEDLTKNIVKNIKGKTKFTYQGTDIETKGSFKRISYCEAIKESCGINVMAFPEKEDLLNEIEKKKIKNLTIDKKSPWSKIVDELFKETVGKNLIQPTLVYDYPVNLVPLAKSKEENSEIVEKFQLYIAGLEISNNFSELNDPEEQEERFLEQVKARKAGDQEAQYMDKDFLTALRYGMPQACGFGFGVDRLVMLLTNNPSIKEVILFPQLKSKN